MSTTHDADVQANRIGDQAGKRIAQLLRRGEIAVGDDDIQRIADRAAEYAVMSLQTPPVRSRIAQRIGPVYGVRDLTEWLVAPGDTPLTGEAIRKRAVQGHLVGFQTDDRQWAFPAYQFDPIAGRLVVRDEVVAVWTALPHDEWRTDVDLAAWMNTRLATMEGRTPAAFARVHGDDHPLISQAILRLSLALALPPSGSAGHRPARTWARGCRDGAFNQSPTVVVEGVGERPCAAVVVLGTRRQRQPRTL